tara:strand:- start:3146 stop:3565 length:420 start_codon:yes stop_codon:yes gene_type:complete
MIIECKCKKYKFKIPKDQILVSGSNVKCGICNEEWYINLDISKPESKNLDILENINPSKANMNFKIKDNKNEIKSLFYTLIFLAIFFIFYKLAINFKLDVLQKFPDLKNFYESLELVTEIIKSYIRFFKELLSEQFINI